MAELEDLGSPGEEELWDDEEFELGEGGDNMDEPMEARDEEMVLEEGISPGGSETDAAKDLEGVETVLQQMQENLPHMKGRTPITAQDKLAAVLTRGKSISVGDPALRSLPGWRGARGPIPINAMFTQKRERLHEERSKTLSPWSSIPSTLETRRSYFSSEEGTRVLPTRRRSAEGRQAERIARPPRETGGGRERGKIRREHGLTASGSSVIMNTRDFRPKASLAGIDELRSLHMAPVAAGRSSILGLHKAKKVGKKLPSLTGVPFGEYRGIQPETDRHRYSGSDIRRHSTGLKARMLESDEDLLERIDDLIDEHSHNRQSAWELDPGFVEVGDVIKPATAAETKRVSYMAFSSDMQKTTAPKSDGSEYGLKTTKSLSQVVPLTSKESQPAAQVISEGTSEQEFVRQAKEVLRKLEGSISKFPSLRSQKLGQAQLSPLLQPQRLILKARFAPASTHHDSVDENDVDIEPKTFSKARDSKLLMRAKFGKKHVKRTIKPTSCHFTCEGKVMIKIAALVKKPATKTIFRWVKKPKQSQHLKLKHIRSRYSTPDLSITSSGTILNTYLLCRVGGVKLPKNLKYIKLHAMRINRVVASDLRQFTSLRFIDLTDNRVPMDSVASAIAIRKLCLQCNRIYSLNILPGTFYSLEILDLSFNNLGSSAVVELAGLPALRRLNIDHNDIKEVPVVVGGPGAFPYLQTLSISGNKLESSCLSILSKISTLERLTVAQNRIIRIPPEIDKHSFIQLVVLNLSYNHIVGSEELAPLMKLRNLDKVLLFGNPLSKRATKDGEGKVLEIAKPILENVEQAKVYGQQWVLEKPKPRVRPPQYSENLAHPPVPDAKLERPRVIPVEKLVTAINRMSKKLFPDEHLSSGVTSRSMPFQEGMDEQIAEVAFARTKKVRPATEVLPVLKEELENTPGRMGDAEAIQELASEPPYFTLEEHIFDANAAFATLKQTISTPLIETVFDVASYQKMTAAGIIRAKENRQQRKQEYISDSKPTTPLVEELAQRALNHQRNVVDTALLDMNFRLSSLETTVSVLLEELKVAPGD